MNTAYFYGLLCLIFGSGGLYGEETADQVATRIIKAHLFTGYYNRGNASREDALKAASANADFHLQKFMLSSDVSEQIRICYALHILRRQVVVNRALEESAETKKKLLTERDSLIGRLADIQLQKDAQQQEPNKMEQATQRKASD